MRTATMPAEAVALPSEQIIPAVRGEFYSYTAEFSGERPLYFLMDCKANKARPTHTDIVHVLRELDLTFVFGGKGILCSPNSAPSTDLLSSIMDSASLQRLNETEIRLGKCGSEKFYHCLDARSELLLVDTFHSSGSSESAVRLAKGMILSVRTASNKYGLLRVEDLTDSTCAIEACHILL